MSKILQTPYVSSIQAFDPAYEKDILFIYNDNQPVKNRAIITDNTTNQVVYDNFINTMKLLHTIPAYTLTPGSQYLLQIQVFDADSNSSNLSDPILFYCYTTPTFLFDNITDNEIYRNASITLEINYSQTENETLKSLQFLEYSYDKTLLSQSGTLYSISPYTFWGLKNNITYYFRAIGETIHGFLLDTGFIKINIEYQTLPANVIFYAENNYREGYIQLTSGIKVVEYEFENDQYTLENGLLTLKNNSLTYKNSFDINGDFILFVEAKKLPLQKFLTTNDDEFSLSIVNVCNTYYCRLSVKDSNLSMFAPLPKAKLSTDDCNLIITNDGKTIEIINTSYDDDSLIVFEVKRIGNLYSLNSYYKSEVEEVSE